MKKAKKILAAVMSAVMMFSVPSYGTSVGAAEDSDVGSVAVGDYIQLGTYLGKPVLWRCVSIDENGPLMLSDKILCYKAFDMAGDNTEGSHGRGSANSELWTASGYWSTQPYPTSDARTKYGSNYWGDSNIRDWLNSDAAEGEISWSCGNPPTALYREGTEYETSYGYKDEAGFLNGFTDNEKKAVKTVTQKQLLDHSEYEFNANYHIYNKNINEILQNYDSAYSELTTDKMFLLDVKQLHDVYENLGDYIYAKDTPLAAGSPSAYILSGQWRTENPNGYYYNSEGTRYYWLRTPLNGYRNFDKFDYWISSPDSDTPVEKTYYSCGSSTRIVGVKNRESITYEVDYYTDIGVRPAFYLDTENAEITEGDGSENEPYVINGEKHFTSFTVGGSSYNIGDYFQMGTYNDKPIVWRCIDVDEKGPLMFANEVLCDKEYDAAGDKRAISGNQSSHWRGNTPHIRQANGSSYWGDSNMHDWLNSDAGENGVEWSCLNPPSYKTEKGFLSNFTDAEKSAVKEATQNQVLYLSEYTNALYGATDKSYALVYNENIAEVLQNYNQAYSEMTTDKMFLPDVKQLYRMYTEFGDYYKSEGKPYWLRTPNTDTSDNGTQRYVDASGNVSKAYADSEGIGVRPAFYLNTENAEITAGDGTAANAYLINHYTSSDPIIEYEAVGGNIYFDTETGTIIKADSTVTEVTIPDSIDGITVSAIADDVFTSCAALTVHCSQGSAADNAALYPEGTKIIYDYADVFVYGDVDCDGIITAKDAAYVLQKALDGTFTLPIESKTDDARLYIDVDCSDSISANDAAFILQKTLQKTIQFPCEGK